MPNDWIYPGATAWYLGQARVIVLTEPRDGIGLVPFVQVRSFASGAAPWVPVRDLKQFEEVKKYG